MMISPLDFVDVLPKQTGQPPLVAPCAPGYADKVEITLQGKFAQRE